MTEKEQDINAEHAEKADGAGVAESTGPRSEPEDGEGRVVYRRTDTPDGYTEPPVPSATRVMARELAPAIVPLIIGFLLLLILISVLAFLSVRRMDEVSVAVLDLEQQHAAKLNLLLKLRFAVTKLN
ncbi:MAG: hypothetical protein M3R69_05345, partial [Acidobacteriota bacterium]|nr:hypothetical protein [Acidobacteriota bacterium]